MQNRLQYSAASASLMIAALASNVSQMKKPEIQPKKWKLVREKSATNLLVSSRKYYKLCNLLFCFPNSCAVPCTGKTGECFKMSEEETEHENDIEGLREGIAW